MKHTITCPHCSKEIFISVETQRSPDDVEKLIAQRTEGIRNVLVMEKRKNQELKKKLEDASH